jgi:hypothetical protein
MRRSFVFLTALGLLFAFQFAAAESECSEWATEPEAMLQGLRLVTLPCDFSASYELPGVQNGGATESASAAQAQKQKPWRGLVELKREYISDGTPPQYTQTVFKVDAYFDGVINLVRVEFPLPDENQPDATFGDFWHPRFGDFDFRFGFRPVRLAHVAFSPYVQFGFPTADPKKLGLGKYMIQPGLFYSAPFQIHARPMQNHVFLFSYEIYQMISMTGDPSFNDWNLTTMEITLLDTWRKKLFVEAKGKPGFSWVDPKQNSGVFEFKTGWNFNPRWSIWAMGGHVMWNRTAPNSYQGKFGMGVDRIFGASPGK